jgi:predicted nucleic acid-binding protein
MLEPLWDQAGKGAFNLATSELTIAEVLVKPIKEDNRALEKIYRELFEATEIKLIPTTRRIWNETATLRARTNLRTPDTVHATTALQEGCATFITNDTGFQRVEGLDVTVLREALPAA